MGSKGGGRKGGGEDDIHAAARIGDVVSVELIISSNPLTLNSRDKHSRTPLHLAAWAGHANVVTALCKHKADLGAAAVDNMAAIHFAAQKGHLEVVRALVSSGVSVKATNRKGMTALHYAVQGSYVELTKYLLKKGADLNTKTKAGKTALDLANNEEIKSLLLEFEKAKQVEAETGKEKPADKDKEAAPDAPLEGKAIEDKPEVTTEENLKRKGEEGEILESSTVPKKSKVSLNHLLASDDIEEDEEQ